MSNLQHRQAKIQAKRKTTPWREFVMEIASWYSLVFHKNIYGIAKMPVQDRIKITAVKTYYDNQDNNIGEFGGDRNLFDSMQKIMKGVGTVPVYVVGEVENSSFADLVHASKNVYLSSNVVYDCDSILYSFNG